VHVRYNGTDAARVPQATVRRSTLDCTNPSSRIDVSLVVSCQPDLAVKVML